jgi:hypothetical protein
MMECESMKAMNNTKIRPIESDKLSNPLRMSQSKAPYTYRSIGIQALEPMTECKSMKVMSKHKMLHLQATKVSNPFRKSRSKAPTLVETVLTKPFNRR